MGNSNLDGIIDRAGEIPGVVSRNVKSMAMARAIQKELEEGADLAAILHDRIPSLTAADADANAVLLRDGIRSVNEAMEQTIDSDWVTQRISKAVAGLDNRKRVLALGNLVTAVTTEYPALSLDEETVARIEAMKAAEENTSEDVDELMGLVGTVLPQVGVMLQRATVSATMKAAKNMDADSFQEHLDLGDRFVTAYAAAKYIVSMSSDGANGGSPYDLGAAAAAAVESSRLTRLYFSGRLTLEALQAKLSPLYTAVVTFLSESTIPFLAAVIRAALFVGAIFIFAVILQDIFTSDMVFLAVSALLGKLWIDLVAPQEEIENMVRGVWNILCKAWDSVLNAWHTVTGAILGARENAHADQTVAAVTTEDATADAEATEDEEEEEEEDEDEDEDEDEEEDEASEVFA